MATYKGYQTMKRILTFLIFLTLAFPVFSKEHKVHGPQGGLAMELTLPDDFNEDTDKCPMVILMHGIFSSKNIVPIPALAMWDPYVSKIGLLGHSQGGVVASMTAGIREMLRHHETRKRVHPHHTGA